MAKAAEVTARRVLADEVLPAFKLLRELVAAETAGPRFRNRTTETGTVGSFSYRTEIAGAAVIPELSSQDWNRIRKSLREWANDL